ncbi:MAG: hypothetical protein AAFS01_04280 [Pseudomonadota bacterium]
MALSEPQFEWIQKIAKMNITQQSKDDAKKAQERRQSALLSERAAIERVRAVVSRAQDVTLVHISEDAPKGDAWKKVALEGTPDGQTRYEMPWRASKDDQTPEALSKWMAQVDLEVDTRADLRGDNQNIPGEKVAALHDAYQRLMNIQNSMKAKFDPETGKPFFTDDDIRRELWSPLVRSGVIPDNIVPAEYSEHAQAFAGAAEFYSKKIEDFSKTTNQSKENWKTAFKFSKEVVSLAGALTAGSLTLKNAVPNAQANSRLVDNDAEGFRAQLAGRDGNDVLDAQNGVLSEDIARREAESRYAQEGTSILLGVIGTAELIHDHATSSAPSAIKWRSTIENALGLVQNAVPALVGMSLRAKQQNEGASLSDDGNAAAIDAVVNGTRAGISGARMANGIVLVCTEKDDNKRKAMLKAMIADLAATIEAGIVSATSSKVSKTSGDAQSQARFTASEYLLIARSVKAALIASCNIAELLEELKKEKGDPKKIANRLFISGLQVAFAASAKAIYSDQREEVDPEELAQREIHERILTLSKNNATRERAIATGAADMVGATTDAFENLGKAIDAANKEHKPLDPKIAEAMRKEIEDKQREYAEGQLKEAFSEDGIKSLVASAQNELAQFNELYSTAFPDPDIEQRPAQEVVNAQQAIERAMARTSELRMKANLINGLTSAGAQVLASLVPGVGAVVAAQRLVHDLYVLNEQIKNHNAWVQSMENAFASASAVAPAIQNTLETCRVTLDLSKVRIALDALQVGAEAGRVFDPTGATTIVSAGAAMSRALTTAGYTMWSETQIKSGWKAYQDAMADRGDRKKARKALRMNSTLAKCCVAYGATIMGDPAAQRAIVQTGLTAAALQNDKDICVRLIAYLENELSDQPSTMKIAKAGKKKWHPGTPKVSMATWASFKAAAHRTAEPKMDAKSLDSPAIDRCLVELAAITSKVRWNDKSYIQSIKTRQADSEKERIDAHQRLEEALISAASLYARLDAAWRAYAPVVENTAALHAEMSKTALMFAQMAKLGEIEARAGLDLLEPDGIEANIAVETAGRRAKEQHNADQKTKIASQQ